MEQKHDQKKWLAILSVLLCISLILNGYFLLNRIQPASGSSAEETAEETAPGELSREGYTLEQVVVLSRHNIRAPLSGNGSALASLTPHTWFSWSSGPSELSLRGGVMETMMGQYFRKWLAAENLIPENAKPAEGEVRIYANSMQRTIATSEYFTAGMFPVGRVPIETQGEFNQMNPVFHPRLTFTSPEYEQALTKQVHELYDEAMQNLKPNYDLLFETVDIDESAAWKDGSFTGFDPADMNLVLQINEEPGMTGSLKTGCSLSDALILQYYEEKDADKASFGHHLTSEQWHMISDIKDTYNDVLFTTPLAAVNTAHPLLQEIRSELNTEGRIFTFLCGHDSNLGSVLAALSVDPYILPGSVEKHTPIGSKVVLSRWKAEDGSEWISADLVYQTTDQIRGLSLLSMENHPAVFSLSFSGLEKNGDGLFAAEDFMNRLNESIDAYEEIKTKYHAE